MVRRNRHPSLKILFGNHRKTIDIKRLESSVSTTEKTVSACQRFLLHLSLVTILSTGGCNGDNLNFPPQGGPSSTILQGVAFDGPILQGTVSLEHYPPGSGVLASGTTDQSGNFSFSAPVLDSQEIYVLTVSGGKTLDLATGNTLNLTQGDELLAIGTGQDFSGGSLSVTPFTSLETSLAEHLLLQGIAGSEAIKQSADLWSGYLGFDPLKTPVADPTLGLTQANSSGLYGIALAGLSQMAFSIGQKQGLSPGTTNTFGLLVQLENDITDGIFNGLQQGSSTSLSYYGYSLTSDSLRKDLAAGILEFLWNNQNKSGLTPLTVDGFANSLALNTSSLFSETPGAVAPDPSAPSVTVVSPVVGQYYRGTLTIMASASDDLGIGSFMTSSPNLPLPGGSIDQNPLTTSFDTASVADGSYNLIFTATDYAGHTASKDVQFSVDNTPPTISNLSPTNNQTLTFCAGITESVTVTGTLTDTGSGPNFTAVAETTPASTQLTSTFSLSSANPTQGTFQFTFTVPSNGCKAVSYTFTLTGYDNLLNSSTIPYSLTIEN